MVNPSDQKISVQDLTCCEGVLESPNSPAPAGRNGETGSGETPEKPIPNSRKLKNDSKNGERTDRSTVKSQLAQVKKKLKNGH